MKRTFFGEYSATGKRAAVPPDMTHFTYRSNNQDPGSWYGQLLQNTGAVPAYQYRSPLPKLSLTLDRSLGPRNDR
jgi:hypothetical protein